MRIAVLFLCCSLAFASLGQHLSGRVVDEATGEPLGYVTIGLGPQGPFTLSRADGAFTLTIADSVHADTITFSCLGYRTLRLACTAWPAHGRDFVMHALVEQLPMAEVTASRTEERRLGIRSHHAFFNFLLEANSDDGVLAMAQVVDLGPTPVRIEAVNLYVAETPMDSATFRIGFRGFDGERPTGPLVERSLVRRVAVTDGWQRLDLSAERIALAGKVAVDVELLPDGRGTKRYMAVGIRLGGGEPGFDRRSTFAIWAQMPHRWSINVSAQVPVGRPEEAPEDPDPYRSAVDARLWSPAVQDSFSIAFGLPEHFDPARPGGYATVFLLDANVFFADVVAGYRKAARKGELPPVIVVGVGYHDIGAMDTLRQRDYNAPASPDVPYSGGGSRFQDFLSEQLVPYVSARFPTDPAHCALAGHSAGGYFVLNTLLGTWQNGATPFTVFVAASPAVDYAGGVLAKAWETDVAQRTAKPLQVFIGHEDPDPHMQRAIDAVVDRFGSRAIVQHYRGADHMAVALPSLMDGLKTLWGAGKE